jgi:hypothetical protein
VAVPCVTAAHCQVERRRGLCLAASAAPWVYICSCRTSLRGSRNKTSSSRLGQRPNVTAKAGPLYCPASHKIFAHNHVALARPHNLLCGRFGSVHTDRYALRSNLWRCSQKGSRTPCFSSSLVELSPATAPAILAIICSAVQEGWQSQTTGGMSLSKHTAAGGLGGLASQSLGYHLYCKLQAQSSSTLNLGAPADAHELQSAAHCACRGNCDKRTPCFSCSGTWLPS